MRVLIALVALAVASPASAQNPGGIPWEDPPERRMTVKRPVRGEWMIGVDGGWANNMQSEFENRTTRFSGFVERNVAPWVGVQADWNCGKTTILPTAFVSGSQLGVCIGSVSAVIPIPVAYSLWPYVRVGGGFTLWDEDAIEGIWNVDDTSPAAVAAVGARYFPFGNDRVALRIDIQRTQTSLDELSVGQWGYGFGVAFRIP